MATATAETRYTVILPGWSGEQYVAASGVTAAEADRIIARERADWPGAHAVVDATYAARGR